MTILIGWLSIDGKGPGSAYLLSDSRYSWGSTAYSPTYNYGRKLFALNDYPDVFGYCGDVVFSHTTLSQIAELADSGLLFSKNDTSFERKEKVLTQLSIQFADYTLFHNQTATIYHLSRDIDYRFKAYRYNLAASCNWNVDELKYEYDKSNLLFADGSGREDFLRLYSSKYKNGDLSGTSRNIYQCFCHMLEETRVTTCGGAPQLVGLYRGEKYNGVSFGTIFCGKRYYYGSPMSGIAVKLPLRWYNENFEICDGSTMRRMHRAMPQPNPNR